MLSTWYEQYYCDHAISKLLKNKNLVSNDIIVYNTADGSYAASCGGGDVAQILARTAG